MGCFRNGKKKMGGSGMMQRVAEMVGVAIKNPVIPPLPTANYCSSVGGVSLWNSPFQAELSTRRQQLISKSVLVRVPDLCMLVLRLCCEMVASQHVVDTRQMLYK